MSASPMIGGTQSPTSSGDFIRQCVAAHALPSVASNCTAPNYVVGHPHQQWLRYWIVANERLTGMLNSMVVKLSNPNDFTINGPKVEMPPDGMETTVSNAVQIQVFGSKKHSHTWSDRHSPDEMPIWFMRRRSMARSLSSPLRKRAFIGESGRKRKITREKTTVSKPQKRKMIW